MNQLTAVLAWLVILAGHVALWPEITTSLQPAFPLAAALAVGLTPDPVAAGPGRSAHPNHLWTGFWLALTSGAVLDFYAQHHFGLLVAASGIGYATIWLVVRLPADDLGWPTRLTAAAIAGGVYEIVILTVFKLTVAHFPFLAELGTTATLNVLGTVGAFALFSGFLAAIRRRR